SDRRSGSVKHRANIRSKRRARASLTIALAALNELDLVAFRRVDKGDRSATSSRMRTIGERIALGRGLFRELLDVVDFEGEMSQIRTDHDRAARVVFAKLNFFFASRGFEKDQLRAATGGMPAHFL